MKNKPRYIPDDEVILFHRGRYDNGLIVKSKWDKDSKQYVYTYLSNSTKHLRTVKESVILIVKANFSKIK